MDRRAAQPAPRFIRLMAVVLALAAGGCLDPSLLDGKRCDAEGRCLPGYVCDPASQRCLPEGQVPDGGDLDAGRDGDGDAGLDGDEDADPDGGDGDAGLDDGDGDEPPADPVVYYRFEDIGDPPRVRDESGRAPLVDLTAAERDPLGLFFSGRLVHFSGGRLQADPEASTALAEHLRAAGALTVVAWAATDDRQQTGPKRLVTLSSGAYTRAFTLGQEAGAAIFRLRTAATGENGIELHLSAPAFEDLETHLLVAVYDGATGLAQLYVDGAVTDAELHWAAGAPAGLEWNTERERFGLGDEFIDDRRWGGKLFRVEIHDRALAADEVQRLLQAGWN